MNNTELLKKGMEIYDIDVSQEIVERFHIYMSLLIEWNKKMNLTAITDEREIVIKHFLDSLSCMQTGLNFSGKKMIDVGTGAGFPGIPLKVIKPEIDLTLLDSLSKRTIFLTEVMEKMGLKALIVHGRAEDYGKQKGYREEYDIAVSRAVANMAVLVEYMIPFVKVGGHVLCQKGPGIYEEIEDAGKAVGILGGRIKELLSTKVYSGDFSHYIAIIEKVKICPGKFPRKAGNVEKKPLK